MADDFLTGFSPGFDSRRTDGGFVDTSPNTNSSTPQAVSNNLASGSPSIGSIQSLLQSSTAKINYADPNPFTYHPSYMLFIDAPHLGANGRFEGHLPETFDSTLDANYGTPFSGGGDTKTSAALKLMGLGNSLQIQSMQVWEGSQPVNFTLPVQLSLQSDTEKDLLSPLRTLLRLVAAQGPGSKPLSIDANGSLQNSLTILTSPGPKVILGGNNGQSLTFNDLSQRITPVAKQAITDAGGLVKQFQDKITSLAGQSVSDGAATVANDVLSGYGINTKDAIGAANQLAAGTQLFAGVQIINNISMWVGSFEYYPSIVINSIGRTYEIKLDRYTGKPIALEVTINCSTLVTPKAEDLATMIPGA